MILKTLWVWAWNNEIEKAKTRAAPETLEKVGEGIIRLNPLEIIEDLYRVVRAGYDHYKRNQRTLS